MKNLVGKVITEKADFMGETVEIRKLSVSQVMEVQKIVKNSAKSKKEEDQLGLLRDVIRLAVVGAEELSDEDFNTFPLSELNELTNKVLRFSGLYDSAAGN